jgi:ferrous iron transport protein B
MNTNKDINVVLIGNPNTGKTSLLNALTGMSQHVGNWPGKTVEKKEGLFDYKGQTIHIVDLPGTYSVAPYSEEEKVSHEYLITQNPDVIIQTIDVNALERNLMMTMELLALDKKIILAFNFNREARKQGVKLDTAKISELLQLPIVEIEANKGENKEKLLEGMLHVARNEFKRPDYLPELLKDTYEIHHDESLKFFREKLTPFYSTEKTMGRTGKIDAVLLNKYTAFPIFLLVIFSMFTITFSLSRPLVNIIDNLFGWMGGLISLFHLPKLIASFFGEGVIGGVGSVLAFSPLIFILFILIALLEDSGYLGRTVVLVDPIFAALGISGRTFIPMILGFGCNVPAIMATRTIKDHRERNIAIFINSFMSCGARLPVYIMFTGVFFPKISGYIVMLLYLFGVMIAFIMSWILSKMLKNQEQQALIIELPPYRIPTLKNIFKHAWYHTQEFMKKAGTIILGSVLVIWVLASLPAGVKYGSEASILGKVGKFITPVFQPLGFGHWTFSVALIFGIVAKETIIGTLGTLYGAGDKALSAAIAGHLSPAAGLAFLVFVLLYIPCLATITIIRKESGSWKFTLLQLAATILIAWSMSFLVYHIAWWLGLH